MTSAGTTQKTVNNLIPNSGFEYGSSGWITNGDVSFVADSFLGSNNKKMRTVSASTTGYSYVTRSVALSPGTYTLSCYVKTENVSATGGRATLEVITSDGWYNSEAVSGTTDTNVDNGWKRIYVTFTLAQGQSLNRFTAGVLSASGTAYFDNLQLEDGSAPNKYNLLENSSFENSSSGIPTNYWSNNLVSDDGVSTANYKHGTKSLKISGQPTVGSKFIAHDIQVSGKEGDIYSLSGWAKANAIPNKQFEISAAIIYEDDGISETADFKWAPVKFNTCISDWQFASGIISTDDGKAETNRNYTRIDIYIYYW